ncbi:MAG TPA: hypothetical protein VE404_04565 [Verrucomicrobiae bacterium]|nr:hypothetical protein [Verrucomicrobiae bacterium]
MPLRAALAALASLALMIGTSAALEPADKVAAVASNMEVMQVQGGAGSSSSIVTLLRGTLRNSSPTDLIIDLTAETGLYTTATLLGAGDSEARAKIVVWIEIDGQYVPVTYDSNGDGVFNDPDNGRVVLNNRDFGLSSVNLAAVLTAFQRTRSANAFHWVALNVGSGIHTIEVKGYLETTNLGAANAAAAVGKRVMIVEPSKLANDATV